MAAFDYNCHDQLKEAREEIERLRAEVARLQAQIAFMSSPENHTAEGLIKTFNLGPPNLHGDRVESAGEIARRLQETALMKQEMERLGLSW